MDSVPLSSSPSDEIDNSSFESFGDFGDFQSADGVDIDFEPFAIGTSHDRHDSTSLSPTSTNISAAGHIHVSDNADEDEDDGSSLALTPTSGSWTIANECDGFEEITRI